MTRQKSLPRLKPGKGADKMIRAATRLASPAESHSIANHD